MDQADIYVREMGISLTDSARHLVLRSPGISSSVERGEIIARESGYQLVE